MKTFGIWLAASLAAACASNPPPPPETGAAPPTTDVSAQSADLSSARPVTGSSPAAANDMAPAAANDSPKVTASNTADTSTNNNNNNNNNAVATTNNAVAAPTPASSQPDNSRVNKRDTSGGTLTPMDQGPSESDRKITQQIRQAVVKDGSLSFTAKNVKIITVNGKVTLRGPVKSDQERSNIEAAAKKIAGDSQVDNQLEVKK